MCTDVLLADGGYTLAAAIIALVGAIIGLVRVILEWYGNPPTDTRFRDFLKGAWKRLALIGFFGSTGLIVLLYTLTSDHGVQPRDYTEWAWKKFNKKEYVDAIRWADLCVHDCRVAAEDMQDELEKAKTPLPPVGDVSDVEKKEILARGPLNDVATCLWIKGRALEELRRDEEAMQTYRAAKAYTYARCWDPGGWFWSPPDDASGRLRHLEGQGSRPVEGSKGI